MSICAHIHLRHNSNTRLVVRCSRIDFSAASEEAIEHLAHACQPAKFGLNQVDVLDETYRKAGKLNFTHFSATFDLERTGLMEEIRDLLLDGHPSSTSVRAELYKLNVYGKCMNVFDSTEI